MFLPQRGSLPSGLKLAVAGGLDLTNLERVVESGVDVAIIGSAITGAEEPEAKAREFAEMLSR